MLKIISSIDGPVWVDGDYKLAGDSWHSGELTHATVIHWTMNQSLLIPTNLGLLIFSCQILVQGAEKRGRREDT